MLGQRISGLRWNDMAEPEGLDGWVMQCPVSRARERPPWSQRPPWRPHLIREGLRIAVRVTVTATGFEEGRKNGLHGKTGIDIRVTRWDSFFYFLSKAAVRGMFCRGCAADHHGNPKLEWSPRSEGIRWPGCRPVSPPPRGGRGSAFHLSEEERGVAEIPGHCGARRGHPIQRAMFPHREDPSQPSPGQHLGVPSRRGCLQR